MTTQKKKTTRRKAYKNMSVPELVKARQELVEKMQQIDEILNQAVAAVGAVRQSSGRQGYYPQQTQTPQQALSAQVANRNSNGLMTPSVGQGLKDNQTTAFSIFDAESFNAGVESGEVDPNGYQQEYLVDNPGRPVNSAQPIAPAGLEPIKPLLPAEGQEAQTDMSNELDTLMSEVSEGLKNVKSTPTVSED